MSIGITSSNLEGLILPSHFYHNHNILVILPFSMFLYIHIQIAFYHRYLQKIVIQFKPKTIKTTEKTEIPAVNR